MNPAAHKLWISMSVRLRDFVHGFPPGLSAAVVVTQFALFYGAKKSV